MLQLSLWDFYNYSWNCRLYFFNITILQCSKMQQRGISALFQTFQSPAIWSSVFIQNVRLHMKYSLFFTYCKYPGLQQQSSPLPVVGDVYHLVDSLVTTTFCCANLIAWSMAWWHSDSMVCGDRREWRKWSVCVWVLEGCIRKHLKSERIMSRWWHLVTFDPLNNPATCWPLIPAPNSMKFVGELIDYCAATTQTP